MKILKIALKIVLVLIIFHISNFIFSLYCSQKLGLEYCHHYNIVNQHLRGSSFHASGNIWHHRCVQYVCERLPHCLFVCVCVCQEVDCCGGGDRGCRAPNEGVCNKISATGSSSAPRLPQTPSDWKWNSCDDLIYMLITNGPPENRPINVFLLQPVSPTTQGNELEMERLRGRGPKERCTEGGKATVINCLSDFIKTKIIWWRCVEWARTSWQ